MGIKAISKLLVEETQPKMMLSLHQICSRIGVCQYHFSITKACFDFIFHGDQYTFNYEFEDPNHS